MNLLRSLHETAMEYSFMAGIAKAKGFEDQSKAAFRIAFDLEKEAATKAHVDTDTVSRYILLRSAASLAYKAGLFEESERLIEQCRAENPPAWILVELAQIAALIKKANAVNRSTKNSHLQLEGILTDMDTRNNELILEDRVQSRSFSIIAPRNLLVEIFNTYWSKSVSVKARRTSHGVIVLENISISGIIS